MEYLGVTLDEFQVEAIQALDNHRSVLVSAPTGCGKTLIAEYAVEKTLEEGKRIVYTAPIKALSNQKYRDFRHRFGAEKVGIQTGDVTINPDAPVLIMTTEIFRNLIFENAERIDAISYVIFDEIHFLDDLERGTVWEECIILAPEKIRFICLSATISNISQLSQWMSHVRNEDFCVIEETQRPVPLKKYLYSTKYGYVNLQKIRKIAKKSPKERKRFSKVVPSPQRVVRHLVNKSLVPSLYFCFNRKACERNAQRCMGFKLLNEDEQKRAGEIADYYMHQYNIEEMEKIRRLRALWMEGCAYHHAGMLPAAKDIVERLFGEGLIKILFCTSTFALGINMPARAVVFDALEKFNGIEVTYLMNREFSQMAGRAGRRGMDEVGYVYSLVIPETANPKEIQRVLYGKNEKIKSRFSASYSTILNLYSRFGDEMIEIFKKSFKNYRQGTYSLSKAYKREEGQIRNRIAFLKKAGYLEGLSLTDKGTLASYLNGYEIELAELYYARCFDECEVEYIPVILGALITDSRKPVTNQPGDIHFEFNAQKVIRKVRAQEKKCNIAVPISEMDFSLAAPILLWTRGANLSELSSLKLDEGDIIRVLRMTVQLMRTLRDRLPDYYIGDKMHAAIERVNRDVVDAQAELEVE